MCMRQKWLLCMCVSIMLLLNMTSRPHILREPPSVVTLITCMSVMHVMSDHVKPPHMIIWHSMAHEVYTWLHVHVPPQDHAQLNLLQHDTETQVIMNLIDVPHMLPFWILHAVNCHQELMDLMSVHT